MTTQKSIQERIEKLTPYQKRIVQLAMQSKTNKEIAQLISSKEYAIRKQFSRIYRKLDLPPENRTKAGMIILLSQEREWCKKLTDAQNVILPVNKILNLNELQLKRLKNEDIYCKVIIIEKKNVNKATYCFQK